MRNIPLKIPGISVNSISNKIKVSLMGTYQFQIDSLWYSETIRQHGRMYLLTDAYATAHQEFIFILFAFYTV